jgi:UDP-N-acetylglucosamine 4,6-dehydratase
MESVISKIFNGKRLLITGGTGSFGNAVLSRMMIEPLTEIRVFSRDEKKQEDMRLQINNPKVKFLIGDVRNYNSIADALDGVDYVFHAAALKQVPSCEFYPMEAVRTNILGAENVMRAARLQGVKKVVVLSTDKAVYPINAMGVSKAMMEKIMVAHSRAESRESTVFCATRYGNVMGSRGSVIPLFVHQIKSGLPITITDPNMTRFLMSLEDSVDLVLHAFTNANAGDIFVQKSPAATVADLATAIAEMMQVSPEIKHIGTRHGEKLYESLVSREEMSRALSLEKYFRIPTDGRDLNYDRYFVQGDDRIQLAEDYTSHNTVRLGVGEIISVLRPTRLIPERD